LPTYAWLARFGADLDSLTPDQQAAFLNAVSAFVRDLRSGRGLRKALPVKGVKGAGGVFKLSWASDGRATFEYGDSIAEGEAHIV
jgi:hypothetical protein